MRVLEPKSKWSRYPLAVQICKGTGNFSTKRHLTFTDALTARDFSTSVSNEGEFEDYLEAIQSESGNSSPLPVNMRFPGPTGIQRFRNPDLLALRGVLGCGRLYLCRGSQSAVTRAPCP